MSAIPQDVMPPILAEIAGVIGLDDTLKLVKHFGGIRIYVPASPRKVRPEHPLAIAIGLDPARQLTEVFAGAELPIPKMDDWRIKVRNAEISRLYREDGWPAWRIARRYSITERYVWEILSRSREAEDDRQEALF